MRKPKTANQYLASIGIGAVNPVCAGCHKEVGRVWTTYKLCVDCVAKHVWLAKLEADQLENSITRAPRMDARR